jgi:uncharacterized membrane protein YcaP (DUF421 family)
VLSITSPRIRARLPNFMTQIYDSISTLLGLEVEPKNLTFLQISLRGMIVLTASLVMVRMSSKRSLAQRTAFDAVLIVVLASVLARAINGSASFFPTLGSGFVFVLLHRALAAAAYHSHTFGRLIKGQPATLVQDGKMQADHMRRNHISEHDLQEDMRLEAKTDDLSKIKIARVERSGEISFIKQQ